MRITSDFMTGVKYFGEPVYQAVIPRTLNTALCTKNSIMGTQCLTQFSDGEVCPWNTFHPDGVPTIYSEEPITHRVYNLDELEFMVEYEELGGLELDLLEKLAEPHDRCSFVVTPEEFMNLLGDLSNWGNKYKYISNLYNIERDFSRLIGNGIPIVSFYKLPTFIYDIYNNNPSGVGVAFEVLDKKRSKDLPMVLVGCYTIYTDVYEGIFYLDGSYRLQEVGISVRRKVDYFRHIMDLCAAETPKPAVPALKTKKTLVSGEYKLSGVEPRLMKGKAINASIQDAAAKIDPGEEAYWDVPPVGLGEKSPNSAKWKKAHIMSVRPGDEELLEDNPFDSPAKPVPVEPAKTVKPSKQRHLFGPSAAPPSLKSKKKLSDALKASAYSEKAMRSTTGKSRDGDKVQVVEDKAYYKYIDYANKNRSDYHHKIVEPPRSSGKTKAEKMESAVEDIRKKAKRVGITFSEDVISSLDKKPMPKPKRSATATDYKVDTGTDISRGFAATSTTTTTGNSWSYIIDTNTGS